MFLISQLRMRQEDGEFKDNFGYAEKLQVIVYMYGIYKALQTNRDSVLKLNTAKEWIPDGNVLKHGITFLNFGKKKNLVNEIKLTPMN